ncbi:MAG: ATP-dependent RNA helicase HrpA [Spartobacteria bacterium]|nr:ATP-dependent RNA helicase HrpA [Spartobacteria bacterium]
MTSDKTTKNPPPLHDARLRVAYPAELPISSQRAKIATALAEHPVIIVCGATGSGKTTQLPKIAWEQGRGRAGRIGCTQPRRLAAVSMATRVAEEMNAQPGKEVGCQVRFNNNTCDDTVIKFMTDGILLAETQHDRLLRQYDTLIIDEAHERSLNIDFILGYLKTLLPERPELKIIISSATLDAEGFSRFFNDAPVLQVEGRTFPVEDFFLPPLNDDEELSRHVRRAVQWISDLDERGDILVFLPGEREIGEAADVLHGQALRNTDVLPLYGRLSMNEQQRVFKTGERRRVILATNVAETSITIPGIHYVIDSGLARLSRFNPRTQIQGLQIEQISQASARQRRGRCGRIADGICVYLYDEEILNESPPYTEPEIRRTSLAGVILQMDLLGLPPIDAFPLMDPPSPALINEGYKTLYDIGAIDKNRRITSMGRTMARFPVDPHVARMICQARTEGALQETLILAAVLSIQDPRERPAEKAEIADEVHRQWQDEKSDFSTLLNIWNYLVGIQQGGASQNRIRQCCKKSFLNYRRVREWQNLYQELKQVCERLKWKNRFKTGPLPIGAYDRLHRSVLSGIPVNIGVRDERKFYHGARGRDFHIFPGSGLFNRGPEWVMAFALVETGRVYARQAAAIQPAWLEDIAPHLCASTYSQAHWDATQGFVYAKEAVVSNGLTLVAGRNIHYGNVRPKEAREMFIRDGLAPGNLRGRHPQIKKHQAMLQEITALEEKIRRPHSLLDTEAVYRHFDRLVPKDICSTKALEQWMHATRPHLAMSKTEAMYPGADQYPPEDYPDHLDIFGCACRLTYRYAPGEPDDGLCLYCPVDKLNLLTAGTIDWLVPGWLPEKLRMMIRSLGKPLRAACNPVPKTIEDFLDAVARGDVDRDQPLRQALAHFLRKRFNTVVGTNDFDHSRLPDYLVMKVAVQDGDGKIIAIEQGLPDASSYMSGRPTASMPSSDRWNRHGLLDWPEDPLPLSIALDGQHTGYPALIDEGTAIGIRVFLEESEAQAAHRNGLCRLFRLCHADHIAFIEKRLPLSTATQLTLCRMPGKGRTDLPDFMDNALYDALTDMGRHSIRDAASFKKRAAAARQDMYSLAERYGQALNDIMQQRDEVLRAIDARARHPACADGIRDIRDQLTFLFHPQFMRSSEIWSRYPRYLKALITRLDRMRYAPQKDQAKWQNIQPYQARLNERLDALPDRCPSPRLLRFALLLEEYRINLFAPEVGAAEKASPKRLDQLWDEIASSSGLLPDGHSS